MTGRPNIVQTSLDRGWLTLTMNDPERRNALSADMSMALSAALTEAAPDRSIRGITLRGTGGVFCAGGDLKSFSREIASGDQKKIEEISRNGAALFQQIEHQPQPVLVLIEGAAMAGGLGMACCADIVAVTADAKFALTEVTLGIPPAQIAPYVVRRIGLPAARRLMLTAAKFNGTEAGSIGLADYVASDTDDLQQYAESIQAQVMKCAPEANAQTKAVALKALTLSHDALVTEAATAFAKCLLSEEGREGIASFIGKRKPYWAEEVGA